MAKNLRIAMAQFKFVVGDIVGNTEKIISISHAALQEYQADVVVFPELAITGYPPEDLLLRLEFHQHIRVALQRILTEVHHIVVIVGHPLLTEEGLYNVASVVDNGQLKAQYKKYHLPNYGVFDEKRYFLEGHESCVIDVKGVALGLTICEDIWLPGPVCEAKQAGAEVVINLNASPFHYTKTAEREAVVRQRVDKTKIPLLYINLVGGQDELVFDGESFVMNSKGEVVLRAAPFVENLYMTNIVAGEPQLSTEHMMVLHENENENIYNALVTGVRDYVEDNGFNGAVLGLSGGIDSALTLAIAVDALGSKQVEAVMMPSRYTASMSLEDASAEANALSVNYDVIEIEPVFKSFLQTLANSFEGLEPDVTEENIQARCRGIILMAISNKKHKIVLTTGNKSEMAVGYATLYGDMAGGFAPLKDVPKTLVYRLAAYRNRVSPVIPARVLSRPPSAELAPDQKDEDTLPSYDILDAILEYYVEYDYSAQAIMQKGYTEDVVLDILKRVDRNEYKRRQAPPGIKITRRAFGRDRRYPMTSKFKR